MGGNGWIMPKGVTIMDDDFQSVSWGASGTVGADWLATIGAAGSITRVLNARGGCATLVAKTGTRTFLSQDGVPQVSLQDAPRLYSRWGLSETVTTKKVVGWEDSASAPNDGVAWVIDTVVGNHYYLRGIRGGAVNNIDSGVAIDGIMHVFEIVGTSAAGATGTIDGAASTALTAGQCPVNTTFLQPVANCEPLGVPDGTLCIDTFKSVQSRNTGAAP